MTKIQSSTPKVAPQEGYLSGLSQKAKKLWKEHKATVVLTATAAIGLTGAAMYAFSKGESKMEPLGEEPVVSSNPEPKQPEQVVPSADAVDWSGYIVPVVLFVISAGLVKKIYTYLGQEGLRQQKATRDCIIGQHCYGESEAIATHIRDRMQLAANLYDNPMNRKGFGINTDNLTNTERDAWNYVKDLRLNSQFLQAKVPSRIEVLRQRLFS